MKTSTPTLATLLSLALVLHGTASNTRAGSLSGIHTVFVIVMENFNWASIKGNPDAPYLNQTLLPLASHAEQYYNPPGLHPSLPNYLWLEAGSSFGITNDYPATLVQLSATNHLVTQLDLAGVSWKGYFENLPDNNSPSVDIYPYVSRHNPFVYFDDVSTNAVYGAAHMRPYAELGPDLQQNHVARYNFVIPNMCNDMHDACGDYSNPIRAGDDWLASEIPKILKSDAYGDGGVIFLFWDEGDNNISDGPLGMLALSPLAKGCGYANTNYYTHSSMLRTLQEIFGVTPLLGDAANASDLSDFFRGTPVITEPQLANRQFQFRLLGVPAPQTGEIQTTTNLANWTTLTNFNATNARLRFSLTATNPSQRFYRAVTR
ncbi:MAG: alkaline phosphatase family protein [Limisphaerales bacterium]